MKTLVLISTLATVAVYLTTTVSDPGASRVVPVSAPAASSPRAESVALHRLSGTNRAESPALHRFSRGALSDPVHARPLPTAPRLEARLEGRITLGDAGQAAGLRFLSGPNRGRSLTTTNEGEFEGAGLYPGWALVQVQSGSALVEREVQLRPGPNRRFEVDLAPGAELKGEVVDAQGDPLIGARIRLDGHTAVTGSRGEFRIVRQGSGTGLLTVRSPGKVPYCERIRPSHTGALRVRMERGARLELQVGPSPTGSGEVHLYLFPTSGERLSGTPPAPAYPWHELNPVRTHAGSTVVLEDLPTTRVDVIALHGEARGGPIAAWLDGTRDASLSIPLTPCERVEGHVLLQDGPASAARIVLQLDDPLRATLEALGTGRRFLMSQPIDLHPGARVETRCDGQGTFSLPHWNPRHSNARITVDHEGLNSEVGLRREDRIEIHLGGEPALEPGPGPASPRRVQGPPGI